MYIYTSIYTYNNNNNMKINKQITLDYELLEKLKDVDNASSLINDLLWDYFKEAPAKESIELEKDEINKKLKELKSQESQIKTKENRDKLIKKAKLDPKLVEYFNRVKKRPDVLELNRFVSDNNIPKPKKGVIELLKEYDKIWS